MNATERRELLRDLAYAEVQASELFDQLDNATCDTAADELAGAISRTISNWFARRLADSAESERIEALIGLTAAAVNTSESQSVFPLEHAALCSARHSEDT